MSVAELTVSFHPSRIVMKNAQVKELVLQSLEHERGGAKVYEAALQCATNEELKEEWQNYLQQTRQHAAGPYQDALGKAVGRWHERPT
jgi:rubrerythrin